MFGLNEIYFRHILGYNARPRRKDKDGFSTFSADSGNIHDYMETSEHSFGMIKSRSLQEYDERFVRAPSGRRYNYIRNIICLCKTQYLILTLIFHIVF